MPMRKPIIIAFRPAIVPGMRGRLRSLEMRQVSSFCFNRPQRYKIKMMEIRIRDRSVRRVKKGDWYFSPKNPKINPNIT